MVSPVELNMERAIAVYEVLRSLTHSLNIGHTVKWFKDNQNVSRTMQAGSRKQHLKRAFIADLVSRHKSCGHIHSQVGGWGLLACPTA